MVTFLRPARVILLSVLTLATVGAAVGFRSMDGHEIPVVVTPADSTLSSGDSTSVSVTLSGAPDADQVVALSSSSSVISVPSSVTVPAGQTSAQFVAVSEPAPAAGSLTSSQTVTITASCNGGSASAQVTVD